MKKALSVFIVLLMVFLGAAPVYAVSAAQGTSYYIDSIDGVENGDGLSPETAWKAVPVTDVALQPGDKVLFRRGGTYECTLTMWYSSGTEESPITFSAYGEGKKPLLYTEKNTEVLRFFDCSYVTVSDLEITAHNGGGIWINTVSCASEGITLDNLTIHDIQNYKVESRDLLHAGASVARACVMVKGLPA